MGSVRRDHLFRHRGSDIFHRRIRAGLQFDDRGTQELYKQWFNEKGIEENRIIFESGSNYSAYFNFYNQIDIALDPFPYNGGITTCDTLWMGVPIITLAGGRRVGMSLLHQIGLSEFIAQDKKDYTDLALKLAQNIQKIRELRQKIREKILQSPICNGPLFAHEMETAYLQIQEEWNR